jgi:hypothetical protein
MNRSIITTSSIKFDASQQSHANINLNQSEINQQPLLTINAPDNTLITQSLPIITQSVPHQSQPITAYTMPPVITDALRTIPSNHFSFNATIGPTPQQLMNPLTHPIKTNPTQKITRTSLTRSKTKQDPNKTNPTQNQAAAMETQTEKKRRRGNEQEKQEDVSIVQHFLTAGPGSQDCRDQ